VPLTDHSPVIDDRRFADLVAEARARIPRYTPEWTDLNESDLGMTLVDLFAWMTELLIFRLGKVPKLNYLKFLELLGFELRAAQAATAEITFPVQPGFAEPSVIVPRLTQVATDRPDAEGPVIFETDRALVALEARLDTVLAHDGYAFRNVTVANDGAEAGFEPFGPRATADAGLYLGFSSALEFPSVELDLAFWLKPRRAGAAVACGAAPALAEATLAWEHWDGSRWAALDLLDDQTAAFARSGHVRLQAPRPGRMVRGAVGAVAGRFWIRVRIVRSSYQFPPRLLAVRTNTVKATQAQTVELEVLGGSDGSPSQTFTVTGRPVIDGSLVLEVDEGDGFRPWIEAADFHGSSPDARQYMLLRTLGEVRFGDGRHGRIPVAHVDRPANVRARRYRFGGGVRGNVGARHINAPLTGVPGIDAAKVANPFPSAGGSDEESIEKGMERAATSLKSRSRAVTVEDFELLAMGAGPIARARALPLHHPDFRGVDIPGVVSVVVVPEPVDENDLAPMPTEATLRRVCAHLDRFRLLTTELYVVPPRYRHVTVRADLVVEDEADLAAVKRAGLAALVAYFHPVTGGEKAPLAGDLPPASEDGGDGAPRPRGTGWPFGGDVYYSLVTRRLLVPGVRRIATLTLIVDGEEREPCTDVALEPDVLVASGEHQLTVRYDDPA
jgi:predicted phage baseplate assembly protein